MGIVKSFEHKIFFNWSRHLWNFIGVSGFVAFLTGIILLFNSTLIEIPRSKEEYFGDKLITENKILEDLESKSLSIPLLKHKDEFVELTYQEWLKSKDKGVELLSSREWAEKNNEPYPISKDGSELLDSASFSRYENYRKRQFIQYRKLITSELAKKKNQQNEEYDNYKKKVIERNNVKYGQRIVSPFVIGYGLAVVASSSLSSALLSIERNTRKKED